MSSTTKKTTVVYDREGSNLRDWCFARDKTTGRIYYINVKSKQTFWSVPPELQKIIDAQPEPTASSDADDADGGAAGVVEEKQQGGDDKRRQVEEAVVVPETVEERSMSVLYDRDMDEVIDDDDDIPPPPPLPPTEDDDDDEQVDADGVVQPRDDGKVEEEFPLVPSKALKVTISRALTKVEESNTLHREKSYISYPIRVQDAGTGMDYWIEKRYSDFRDLWTNLKKQYFDEDDGLLPPFPKKKLLGNLDYDFIQQRLGGLRKWLTAVVANQALREASVFLDFIEFDDNMEMGGPMDDDDENEDDDDDNDGDNNNNGGRTSSSSVTNSVPSDADPNKLHIKVYEWRITSPLEGEKPHVEYKIRLDGPGGVSWRIERRFRDFYEMHRNLERLMGDDAYQLARFPAKRLFGNTNPSFLNKRMKALSFYLREVQRLKKAASSRTFRAFLDESGLFLPKVLGINRSSIHKE
eukprot:TRINITY_DN66396_c7_g1_i2.p1 TRINITY_DN66396_c7_g1~~TRINITY_DN66396_c7_g1_i2.p1  ORF type:complete len:467 (+),score=275.04 TRINITY_DN66396_c7_g1_i2:28-1428(+)